MRNARVRSASSVREQISLMLQKNAISEISPDTPGFHSNVFLVRKASGGWRPVIDLKQLNHHINAPHICMHTISSVLSTVQRRDYMIKIHLQDLLARSAGMSHNHKLRTKPFWGPPENCDQVVRTRSLVLGSTKHTLGVTTGGRFVKSY